MTMTPPPLERQHHEVMVPSARYPAWALADDIDEPELVVKQELVRLVSHALSRSSTTDMRASRSGDSHVWW